MRLRCFRAMKIWVTVLAVSLSGASAALAQVKLEENERVAFGLPDNYDGAATPSLKDAYKLFTESNVDGSFEKLRDAVSKDKTLPPARVLQARLFFLANRADLGRLYLEQSAAEDPSSPEVYVLFGNLALAEGQLTDALLQFEKAMTQLNLQKQGDQIPVEKQPLVTQIYNGLLSVAESRPDWKQAQLFATGVLANCSEREKPAAMLRMARAKFFAAEKDGAVASKQELDDAIAAEAAQVEKDNMSLKEGETPKKPVIGHPKTVLATWAAQKGGDNAESASENFLSEALRDAPEDPQVQVYAARWNLERGRADQAVAHAEKAEKLDSTLTELRQLRAIALLFNKQYGEAEALFRNLYLDNPGDLGLANYYVLALIGQGGAESLRKAQGIAEANGRANQRDGEVLATLGWVYFQQGRLNEAEQMLNTAVSAGRASADTAYYLARLLAARGNVNEASQMLKRALDTKGPFLNRQAAQEWSNQLTGAITGGSSGGTGTGLNLGAPSTTPKTPATGTNN